MAPETAASKSSSLAQPAVQADVQPDFQAKDSRTLVGLTLLSLFAVGTVLRFLFLTSKPFWFDECFSVVAARLDWGNFLHLLWWREANMSLYYLLLRSWLHLGGSESFVRSLSVVLAVAALPALYWLGSILFDRRTGIICVALLSVNAYHIRYAQEARSYSLFFLLAVLSCAYFCAYLEKASRKNLLGYIVTSIFCVYAHFYALLLIGTQALAVWLAYTGRAAPGGQPRAAVPTWSARTMNLDLTTGSLTALRRAWTWIGIAVIPLVIFIAKTGAGPIRWIHRPGFREVFAFYESLAGNGGWALLALYASACATAMIPLRKQMISRAAREGEIWRMQFLLLWLLFPVLLVTLLSFARPLFLGRYFIFCLPPLILLAAAGLGRLQKRWQLGVALAVIMLFSVKGTLAYYNRDFDVDRDGIGIASNYVLDHALPGDAVMFHIAGTRVGYEFYRALRREAGPPIVFPHHGERLDYRDFTGKPSPEFLRATAPRYDRVWVVLMNNVTGGNGAAHPDPTTLTLGGIMGNLFPVMQEWEFPQVEVRLYSKR
jgi:mannosyltransferase